MTKRNFSGCSIAGAAGGAGGWLCARCDPDACAHRHDLCPPSRSTPPAVLSRPPARSCPRSNAELGFPHRRSDSGRSLYPRVTWSRPMIVLMTLGQRHSRQPCRPGRSHASANPGATGRIAGRSPHPGNRRRRSPAGHCEGASAATRRRRSPRCHRRRTGGACSGPGRAATAFQRSYSSRIASPRPHYPAPKRPGIKRRPPTTRLPGTATSACCRRAWPCRKRPTTTRLPRPVTTPSSSSPLLMSLPQPEHAVQQAQAALDRRKRRPRRARLPRLRRKYAAPRPNSICSRQAYGPNPLPWPKQSWPKRKQRCNAPQQIWPTPSTARPRYRHDCSVRCKSRRNGVTRPGGAHPC